MAARQLNPTQRLEVLMERGAHRCAWCGYDLHKPNARPTRDHIVPKIKGGPARLENEVASCASCNRRRGHTSPSQFAEQSRGERGVEPNVELIAAQLDELQGAIAREGGMRKIRDYVEREAKRLRAL